MTNLMKKSLTITGAALLLSGAGAGISSADQSQNATSSQGQSTTSLARQDCKGERRFERFEFRQDYRGTGRSAMRRCIRENKREARFDCREERFEDPREYQFQYGSGKAGFKRCVIDELR